ncbi:MAG TPA: MerR family transcriptional regulator [Coriobacteriia bacterium]|nr:MerR family transcriptional regulator [Coriobacteriia bacterium]
MADRDYMTIGEVVETLQPAYPDLTISKIRFLEEEGLIAPDRTAGGYRKFSSHDLGRVDMILRLQKEHFLPLAVIRDKLADYDKGKVPPELRQGGRTGPEPAVLPFEEAEPVALDDVPAVLGLPVSFVRELAEFSLVEIADGASGPELGPSDVRVAHAAWDLRRFGIEPRHLRMYETFAEREATFFGQALLPAFRHRTPETRQRLIETLAEISGLTADLKSMLLRRALARVFEDVA